MEATELMIGDWVKTNDSYKAIKDVKVYAISQYSVQDETTSQWIGCQHIEPIPLDSEIMKNFGFVCSYDDYHQWYIEINHNNLWLEQSRIEPHTYFMRVFNGLKVRYVHELQHALKLCGIDKEINL